jgi:hypothetical protein
VKRRGVVVFGPYPPAPGVAAAATLDEVRGLLATGADVRVISPVPSAAHDSADLRRPDGALRFAQAAVGADRLVLRLDGGLLASKAHRGELPARLAVVAALRSSRRSTVHLPEGVPVNGEWSQVLAAADQVVVDEAPAATPAVEVTPRPAGPASTWELRSGATRADVEAEIRRRAADRRAERRTSEETASGHRPAARTLRALPLLGPEEPRSARKAVAVVKQVVSRLVDWRINPVIEHVNLLHRAVLDAVDGDGARVEGAQLEGAHVEGAQLEGAHVEGAHVEGDSG